MSTIIILQNMCYPIEAFSSYLKSSIPPFLKENKILHNGEETQNIYVSENEIFFLNYSLEIDNLDEYLGKSFEFDICSGLKAVEKEIPIEVFKDNKTIKVGIIKISESKVNITFENEIYEIVDSNKNSQIQNNYSNVVFKTTSDSTTNQTTTGDTIDPIIVKMDISVEVFLGDTDKVHINFGEKDYVINKEYNYTDFEQFITKKEVYRSDENFNPIGNPLKTNDIVSLNEDLSYKIKATIDAEKFKKLNTRKFEFSLPKNMKILSSFEQGIDIGTFKKAIIMKANSHTQKIELTFGEHFDIKYNVEIDMHITSRLSVSDDFADETLDIELNTLNSTSTIKLKVLETQAREPKIETNVKKEGDVFNWEIIFDTGYKTTVPSFVETTISDETQILIKDSIQIESTTNDNIFVERNSSNDGSVIRYQIPKDQNGKAKITYQTILSDKAFSVNDKDVTLSNSANLLDDNNSIIKTATSSIKVSPKDKIWLTKDGEYIRPEKRIKWTINIDTHSREIDNLRVHTILPEKLTLDTNSIKIDDTISISSVSTCGTNEFYIEIPKNNNTYNSKYKLTYETIIDSSIYETNYDKLTNEDTREILFESTSYLNFDWKKTENPQEVFQNDYKTDEVKKSVRVNTSLLIITPSYDNSSHEITWVGDLNNYEVDIKDSKIVINLPTGDFEHDYVKDSFVSNNDLVTLDTTNTKKSQIIINIGNIGTNKVRFSFKTKIVNDKYFAFNNDLKNPPNFDIELFLNGKVGNNEDKDLLRMKAVVLVTSQVLRKENLGYDYSTNEISCKIIVNENKMEMKNVRVEDIFPSEQSFVENSLTVDGIKYSDYTVNNNSLVINLGNLNKGENPKVIEYKTKIDVDKIQSFENSDKATISGSTKLIRDNYGNVNFNSSVNLTNTILQKDGELNRELGHIKYTVYINQHRLNLSQGENPDYVIDTLPNGVRLDLDSVTLTKAIPNKEGTKFEKKPDGEVELNINDNFIYTASTDNTSKSSFQINLPKGNEAYVLEYITDITDERLSPFQNQIVFNKGTSKPGSGDSNIDIGSGGNGSGSIIYPKGTLVIKKLDKERKGVGLSDVKYELYDKKYKVLLETGKTDSKGELVFSSLTFEKDYMIKEVENPNEGYTDDNLYKEYEFRLDSDNKNMVMEFFSNPNKGRITFNNKDNYGDPASGTLYEIKDLTTGSNLKYSRFSNEIGQVAYEDEYKLEVPFGNYLIKEVKPSSTCLPNENEYIATITPDGDYEGIRKKGSDDLESDETIVSTEKSQSIIVKKVNSETNEPIEGVEFTINGYGQNDRKLVTNKEGKVVFDNLRRQQTYTITETPLPQESGYNLQTPEISTIDLEIIDVEVTSKSSPNLGTISFNSVDDWDRPREGVVFEIIKKPQLTNPPYTKEAISDKDGNVIFENVPFGDYEIIVKNDNSKFNTENYQVSLSTDAQSQVIKNSNGQVVDNIVSNKSKTSLTITKTDKVTNEAISGVVVEILDSNGVVRATETTDKDGKVTFKNLNQDETYTIREISPEGYKSLEHTIALGETPLEEVIPSVPNSNTIMFSSKDDWDRPIKGVEFTLTNKNTGKTYVVNSDENGDVIFLDIPFGEYEIKATNAPKNIELSQELYNVSIEKNGQVSEIKDSSGNNVFEIQNKKEETELTIKKVDKVSKKPIEGVEVVVYDGYGNERARGITDKNGEVKFPNLKKNETYTVKEVDPGEGYHQPEEYEIELEEVSLTTETSNIPKSNTIVFKSEDDWKRPLEGVEFILINKDILSSTTSYTVKSDENGDVIFPNVPFGEYEIKVINTPKDIEISDKVYNVVVSKNGDVSEITDNKGNIVTEIQNKKEEVELTIKKVDKETGKPIEGVLVEIYDKNNIKCGEAKTNEYGEAVFVLKKNEQYTVVEKPALGYEYSPSYEVSVGEENQSQDSESISVKNDVKIPVYDENNSPIKDVTIELFGSDQNINTDKPIQSQKSDINGIVTFSKLPKGVYTVVMKYPESGLYENKNIVYKIIVDENGKISKVLDINNNEISEIPTLINSKTNINIEVIDSTSKEGIENVTLKVSLKNDISKEFMLKTDSLGKSIFENALVGNEYTIETEDIKGYNNISPRNVMISQNQEVNVLIEAEKTNENGESNNPPTNEENKEEVGTNKPSKPESGGSSIEEENPPTDEETSEKVEMNKPSKPESGESSIDQENPPADEETSEKVETNKPESGDSSVDQENPPIDEETSEKVETNEPDNPESGESSVEEENPPTDEESKNKTPDDGQIITSDYPNSSDSNSQEVGNKLPQTGNKLYLSYVSLFVGIALCGIGFIIRKNEKNK